MNKQENGSVLVLMAGLIIVLTGFAVLAVDVGRIYIVRNELQNAADSAALAGANCLIRQSLAGSTTECTSINATALNWTRASAKAVAQLGNNSAANFAISTTGTGHQVDVGYWDVNGGTALQPTTLTPLGPCTVVGGVMTTACHKPAVRVEITKDTGKNNGPITMLTAAMFGGANVPMTARAVAVISSPGNVPPLSLIPQVINKCMYDRFWNAATGSPIIFTSTDVDPYGLSVIGQPWVVRIGSAYHYGTCASGQWTTFAQDVNSQSAVGNLITNGNPTPLAIGDQTWIQPGTKTASYNDLDAKFPSPPGADVSIIVVDTTNLTNKGQATIVAFAGFHIDDIQGGSQKFMQGHFIANFITPGSGGIGPFYGTYTPPRLAQ